MLDQALASRADILEEVRRSERTISQERARQVRLLRDLHRRGWLPRRDELASHLDVSSRTAADLIESARRTPEQSPAMSHLEMGDWSFDRTAAVAGLVAAGADAEALAASESRDIAGVHRLRAEHNRVTRRDERRAHHERHVRAWPSLDTAAGWVHAQLTGHDWKVVTTALDDRADALPRDEAVTAEQRRADALVALAHDWLDGSAPQRLPRSGSVVTIVVDGAEAARTAGERGASIPAGPRVGPSALDEIACEGSVEVVIDRASGVPLSVGPTTSVVPPKLRRAVLARDGGCVIDGCTSRYRLEVHHIVPRSQGGTHDPENLATVCWWHHHVAIHGRGLAIDPESPPLRRRLIPTDPDP